MSPFIYIIILNWNGLKDTIECLESLKKITYPNYKVIVVDNGSKNNEGKNLKEKFGDYIYLIQNDKNYGFAEGNNIGIRYALKFYCDYILLLNNDTIVEKNFLTNLINCTKTNGKIGIIGSKIMYYSDKSKIWFNGGYINWFRGFAEHTNFLNKITKKNDLMTGCCMMIDARNVKKENIYLDSRYFCIYEDVDFSVRVKKMGLEIIYCPKSIIYHKVSQSSGNRYSNFGIYYGLRNRLLFMKKNATLSHKLFFYPYIFMCLLLYYPYLAIKHSRADIIKFAFFGFRDFIFGNFGMRFKEGWWK